MALEKETSHRSCLTAFPAEVAAERAGDDGPIGGVDADPEEAADRCGDQAQPVASLPERGREGARDEGFVGAYWVPAGRV